MLIPNLINNNYVAAVDDEENQVIVKGIGIVCKVSKGSDIPDVRIELANPMTNEIGIFYPDEFEIGNQIKSRIYFTSVF